MMNSKTLSTKNLPKLNKTPLGFIAFLSFIGFLDAAYLTVLHYKHIIPPCSIAQGCEKVLTSQFATIGPIPIAILGMLYFLILLITTLMLFEKPSKLLISCIFFLSVGGFITAILLFAAQAFVLQAFCQYCLGAEAIIIVTFFLVLKFLHIPNQIEKDLDK